MEKSVVFYASCRVRQDGNERVIRITKVFLDKLFLPCYNKSCARYSGVHLVN